MIVNWNAGPDLRRCIDSITASSREKFRLDELRVVDNASTDGSAMNLEARGISLRLLQNETNLGFGRACNLGARTTRSDYLLFLNPDVRLQPDTLERLLIFAEQPEQQRSAAVFSVMLKDGRGVVQRQCARFPTPGRLLPQILGLDRLAPRLFPTHFMVEWPHDRNRTVDQVPGGFFLIRRQVFEGVGGFDERFFMYFEDVDLSLRVHQAGWQSVYFAGAASAHAGRGTTDQIKARRLAYYLSSRIRYARKHFHPAAAGLVILATALVEIFPRLLQKLLRGSVTGMREVLQGYLLFWRWMPGILLEGRRGAR